MKNECKTIDEYMALDYPFIVAPIVEDGFSGYRAFLIDIPAIESLGLSPEEAMSDFEEVKKAWFMFAMSKGISIPEPDTDLPAAIKYSGRVTLRIPKSLHRNISERALLDGVSLNAYLNEIIQRGMTTLAAERIYNNIESALSILKPLD